MRTLLFIMFFAPGFLLAKDQVDFVGDNYCDSYLSLSELRPLYAYGRSASKKLRRRLSKNNSPTNEPLPAIDEEFLKQDPEYSRFKDILFARYRNSDGLVVNANGVQRFKLANYMSTQQYGIVQHIFSRATWDYVGHLEDSPHQPVGLSPDNWSGASREDYVLKPFSTETISLEAQSGKLVSLDFRRNDGTFNRRTEFEYINGACVPMRAVSDRPSENFDLRACLQPEDTPETLAMLKKCRTIPGVREALADTTLWSAAVAGARSEPQPSSPAGGAR